MYRVKLKSSAVESHPELCDVLEDGDGVVAFDSRTDAIEWAETREAAGASLRIQRAAPQEPEEVDAYLVGVPRQHKVEPKGSDGPGLTFDPTANLYGELGAALVFGSYGVSPAVRYYLAETTTFDRERHAVRAVGEPQLPDDVDRSVTWEPDCVLTVSEKRFAELVDRYFCEIKTGNASFERGQRADMHRVARTHDVLSIRVDLDGLPEEYTLRVDRVSPE